MSRLQNRLIGHMLDDFRQIALLIRSQILENLGSNSQIFVSARQA